MQTWYLSIFISTQYASMGNLYSCKVSMYKLAEYENTQGIHG